MSKELSDVAAERAVLAGICQYGADCFSDVADIITDNTFTFESNQSIFICLKHLIENKGVKTVDAPSIWSVASDLGISALISKKDEREYLRSLMNFPIKLDNVRRLAGKMRKLEIARNLRNEMDVIKGNLNQVTGDEPVNNILGLVENPVFDFITKLSSSGSGEGPQLMGDGIEAYIEYLKDNKRDMVGISTGYPLYDMAIGGGLRRKTVNLIGARPKIGKTMFADNMALHIAGNTGIPVLNLDTEMSPEDHWNRMIANLSDVPISDIETGIFAQDVAKNRRVKEAVDKLSKMPYYYKSIAGQPFEETVALMRRWVTKTVGLDDSGLAKPCVIIYDYLKLMSAEGLSKNMQEYQMLGFQITGLHNFMVRYGVPCVSFIQLNRDGITREDTDVASGSDRLIWLCSNFTLFKKKSDEEIAEDNAKGVPAYNRKLVPIVARHGEGLEDGDYINMMMVGKFGRIVEGKTRNHIYKDKTKLQGEFIDDANNIPDDSKQFNG